MDIQELYAIYLRHPAVSTDTRAIKQNSIFFALKGDKFNANEFAEQAIRDGCAFAVIDDEKYKKDERYIVVDDVLKTLQKLAQHHRKHLKIPFIGITGSNGKTTTKELIATVLSKKYNTLFTQGNLNNHIGVPLTLLTIKASHEIAVIEMGANHVGEIEMLCNICLPGFGVITNIGKAHLEGFGGPQGVIKAKNELYVHIKKHNGKLFVNADDQLLMDLSAQISRITMGSGNADYNSICTDVDPFVNFKWVKKGERLHEAPEIKTQLIGKYNYPNLLTAVAIGNYFGVSDQQIKEALENYVPSNNRSQVIKKGSNIILLDAYNANPSSMTAALNNMNEMKSDNKMVVLGDMLELGSESAREHQNIADLIQKFGFKNSVLVGPHFSKINNTINAKLFQTSDEALEWLKNQGVQGNTILIKGSRGIRMEKLVEAF